MKDGDGTTQFQQLNVKDATQGDRLTLIRALIKNCDAITDELNDHLGVDEKSLKSTDSLTGPLARD